MNYKVVKYRKKRKCPFETYHPKKRIEMNKENTVPFIFRIGHELIYLGGLLGFWIIGALMGIAGFFHFKKKVNNFSFNKKTIEFRVRKK